MQRKHGQKYEKVVADSGYESLATTAGSKKMGRPLSLSLTITNLVRSIPLRLRSAEWKTWATTNRMTALSARMADIWTMFQNILQGLSEQSTRAYIGITKQAELNCVYMDINEQRNIGKIVAKMNDKLKYEKDILSKYRQIKQGLMKRLLTPPVDAEIVEE